MARPATITVFLFFLGLSLGFGGARAEDEPHLTFFYSPGCHSCAKVKSELMPGIEQRFKDKVIFEYKDITQIENYRLLLSFKERHGIPGDVRVPEIFVGNRYLIGEKEISAGLRRLIESVLGEPGEYPPERHAPIVDLISRFRAFSPLAVIGAGLIDGINPCAFAVIIFFISFLTLHGYRKKEIAVIGLFFVVAVFCAYFLIGLGLFNFLYRMRGFWWVVKTINFSIGIFSIILGVLALHDFFKFFKRGRPEEMSLRLPASLKNKIHSIIGMHYRKKESSPAQPQSADFIKLASSAFVSGFLVSLLEAVCTGQVYLPTITFVFKSTHLKIEAFFYLFLYNIMFVVPLLAIFLVALLGVTSQQLSALFRKHFLTIKMLMAMLFFGLGFFLLWRA